MNRWVVLSLLPLAAVAGEADVLEVEVRCDAERVCRFDVTVKHEDEGWEHYADRWEVLTTNGEVIATRVLAHPHEHEQPFTRSLGEITLPEGVAEVRVRARDSVHGYGGKEVTVSVP
ncbi:MAG: hypothetical protein AAGI27_14855 [Pseudomonadota bacterium]